MFMCFATVAQVPRRGVQADRPSKALEPSGSSLHFGAALPKLHLDL